MLSGACIVRAEVTAALKIAGRMTGAESAEVDDTVQDGIGELCNMLAGSWKGRVPELASNCGLSVPAVITGRNYNLHVQAPKFQLTHVYSIEGVSFEITRGLCQWAFGERASVQARDNAYFRDR